MTPTKIQFVCKLNQVRSPFLRAFFKKHFEHICWESSGVDVVPEKVQDRDASMIAANWGFSYKPTISQLVHFSADTYYFPADNHVEERLGEIIPKENIVSQLATDYPNYIRKPIDPICTNLTQMETELALLILHSVNSIRGFLHIETNHELFLYTLEKDWADSNQIDAILLKYPPDRFFHINLCLKDLRVHRQIRKNITPSPLLALDYQTGVYSLNNEVYETEKFLCSTEFRSWLFSLTQLKPVILITSADSQSKEHPRTDSILAGIWATAKLDTLHYT